MKRGFSLIELLVVISVIALLVSILLPFVARARRQAKVVAVNAELRQVGLALEMYMSEHEGKVPPTRKDCTMGWADHQLPPELVEGGYLPAPDDAVFMSAGMEDRFNPGHTYKYWAVGELIQNRRYIPMIKASLQVPSGFPEYEGAPREDVKYEDPDTSPVTWVVFSTGPNYDPWRTLKVLNGPVPKRTWYDPQENTGIIVRMRLREGRHIGTFGE